MSIKSNKDKKIVFKLEKQTTFIPESYNNKELPKENQMTFKVKAPSFNLKHLLAPIKKDKKGNEIYEKVDVTVPEKRGDTIVEVVKKEKRPVVDQDQLIRNVFDYFIDDVKNVWVEDKNGKEKRMKLEEYEELLSMGGTTMLINELIRHVSDLFAGRDINPLSKPSEGS